MQLYANSYAWEVTDAEAEVEAREAFEIALSEALQGVLLVMQSSLVDTAWPLSWRLCCAPNLLSHMLSQCCCGEEIASHEWHLEVARCSYDYFASCSSPSTLLERMGGLRVWLGFMQVMLDFRADWLHRMLTPDVITRLLQLMQLSLNERKVLQLFLCQEVV